MAGRLPAAGCELIPGGVWKKISAARAGQLREAITPSGAVQAARCELAAAFAEDLRRIGAQIRDAKQKLTAAARAAGTTLTGVFGAGPTAAATVTGETARRVPLRQPGSLRGPQRHRAGPGILRAAEDRPAVPAREPAAQPRYPPGRNHPG